MAVCDICGPESDGRWCGTVEGYPGVEVWGSTYEALLDDAYSWLADMWCAFVRPKSRRGWPPASIQLSDKLREAFEEIASEAPPAPSVWNQESHV